MPISPHSNNSVKPVNANNVNRLAPASALAPDNAVTKASGIHNSNGTAASSAVVKPDTGNSRLQAALSPASSNPFGENFDDPDVSSGSGNRGVATVQDSAPPSYKSAVATTAEPVSTVPTADVSADPEISTKDSNELLRLLTDYCNEPTLLGKKSHKKKLADDFTKPGVLNETFDIEHDKKPYAVVFKTGHRPTTNAQLNEIIKQFRDADHKDSGSLIKDMTGLYRATYAKTEVAISAAKAQTEKHQAEINRVTDKANKPDFFNKASLVDKKYNALKEAYKTVLLRHVSSPQNAPLSERELDAFVHRVMTVTSEFESQRDKKIEKKGKQAELDPFNYDFSDEIKAFFSQVDVDKTTKTFLDSQKDATNEYDASLKKMLGKLITVDATYNKVFDKANRALEKAAHEYKGDSNPFAKITQNSPIAAAIKERSNQVGAQVVKDTVKEYDKNYTNNVTHAMGLFDLKKAQEDSKKTTTPKINEAHPFTTWLNAMNSCVAGHSATQLTFYNDASAAMDNKKILPPQREKALAEIKESQAANYQEVLATKSALLKTCLTEMFKPDFSDEVEQAAKKTGYREYLSRWLGGTTPDIEQGKRVFTKMYAYSKKIDAAVGQIVKDCAMTGKNIDETKAAVLEFRKALPSPTELLKTVNESIPPTKSVWGYFKQSFGLLSGIGTTAAVGATATGAAVIVMGVAGIFTLGIVPIILAAAGGGVLIVGGVMKLRSAINTRQESQAVRDNFNDLAAKIDSGWPDSSKETLSSKIQYDNGWMAMP